MPIQPSEIVWRRSALVSDTTPAQNGGRMAHAQLVSGVKNNLFPDASQAERAAGAVKLRKAFVHIASAQDTALLNARVFLDALTPGDDYVTIAPGTASDTENTTTGRPYGIGSLYAAAAAGATQIRVVCEHNADYATLQPMRVGDTLRVSDMPAGGGVGNEEWVSVSAITYGPDYATIDFAPALANSYGTAATVVSSVLELASVAAAAADVVVTSAAGSFDAATVGNLVAHNKGAIADTWTLTFTGASTFTATGAAAGPLAAGTRSADYAPTNPATGTPYFTVRAQGWGGTFAAGDKLVFSTAAAAIPLWYRRCVPAGAASLANDFASVAVTGESA